MNYVEILVAEATYHGQDALTYSSSKRLLVGAVVVVPLKDKQVLGIVSKVVSKPSFPVKEIIEAPDMPPIPHQLVQLLRWMQAYYPAPLGIITQHFLPRALRPEPDQQESIDHPEPVLPKLTADQQQAVNSMQGPGFHLLHGETGTGKTRVYIELAKEKLKNGQSSMILTPEIGLTSQLANDFRVVFGEHKVIVLHSQLTDTKRQKIWMKILTTTSPLIIIGPRSALFSPVRNLGLIVVDEAHETAYKQDQAPYYHASSVAARLASLHNAALILGSATPLITDYYIAKAKNRPIVYMGETAAPGKGTRHSALLVDLRDKDKFSRSAHLSNELLKAIQNSLDKKEQVLLFLNRRGTARTVFCDQCGWQALCPHCDLPLIYHGDMHVMRCHSCSYRAPSPTSCPNCGNPSIIFRSIGTKALTDEATRLFPTAKIRRFDTDNKKSERIEEQYEDIRKGEVDILIGTQTLAKGLDLPKLSLVGVINAESGLSFPDFSATERTYQLLSQVLGRVNRGHRDTMAVIQTYAPDASILKAVLSKNWEDFYNKELRERETFSFPPFCFLLKLTCRRTANKAAEKAALGLYETLHKQHRHVLVEGPAASFYEKRQNKYQWQLIVKSKNRKELTEIVKELPANWSYDIDPLNLL